MADMIFPGTAAPADVLTGKKFSAGTNYDTDGSMANQGSPTFQPGQSIPVGYYSGGSVAGIKTAFGQVTSSSATATFNLVGGGTTSQYTLTVPVPNGANAIVAVVAYLVSRNASGYWTTLATPLGGLNGVAACLAYQASNSVAIGSGASLQISSAGIVIPEQGFSSTAFYYTVFYY